MIRLIAIDLDGTLLRDDHTYDQDRFQDLVGLLTDQGIQLAIISGHSRQDTAAILEPINLKGVYVASHNGNYMTHNGQKIRQVNLKPADQAWALSQVQAYQDDFLLVADDGRSLSYYSSQADDFHHLVQSEYPQAQAITLEALQEEVFFKLAFHFGQSRDQMRAWSQAIQPFNRSLDVIARHGGWLEFHQVAGGKGAILKRIQAQLGIKPSQTLCFGNRLNDADMNSYAEHSVAMANADPAYQDLSRYLIGSNQDQAVIQVLETYIQTGNWDFMISY
ncbi:HAD family hydrolase [Hutsoniella sourekii]